MKWRQVGHPRILHGSGHAKVSAPVSAELFFWPAVFRPTSFFWTNRKRVASPGRRASPLRVAWECLRSVPGRVWYPISGKSI